jgi:hypothetical protein
MAQRLFELPGIQDLSKEQEAARALPKRGQHLVIGGPGTGKSVLALLRARRHATAREPHVFLVFNKLLHEASRHLGGKDISCHQWMTWFFKLFREITKGPVPRLAAAPGSSWKDIDWENVIHILEQQTEETFSSRPEYLIIDEGQDMPPEFYHVLASLGFENFFVVADQNQQIVSGKNSSRRDIELGLAIESDQVIELNKNYRNTAAVARLAGAFYTGDIASPFVAPPLVTPPLVMPHLETGKKANVPVLFTYKKNQFGLMIERILKMADRDPSKLIGVIAPDNQVRDVFFQALECETQKIKLDNGNPCIRTYHRAHQKRVNFHEGGIMVINAQACKGLEFDHVFMADIDAYYCQSQSQDTLKRLFYVMVARARDNVTLLRSADNFCPANCILPEDSNILKQHP